jgi:hypothetical protein
MFYCFIIVVHFKECLAKKKMSFYQIGIHVERSPTILTRHFPSFQLQMTKGPISEVGWDVGVFNLQLLTLNEEAEINFTTLDSVTK